MQSKNLPGNLPMLPGNVYADPTVTRHHKTQLLGIKSGTICEKTTSLSEPPNVDMLASMRQGAASSFTGVPNRPAHENDAVPKIAPKWLKHDRHVLRFQCYFQESVVESPNENFRIHKCTLLYYLDDDTIHILEDRMENAGLPQGVFLKRHKVPKDGRSSECYNWSDITCPMNLTVYSRVFRIYDCDDFTRSYYANEGVNMGPKEALPEDPYKQARAMINYKQNPPDQAEMKNYNEVRLGGGCNNSNLHSFLENDRKVLCFSIFWEDSSYDGGDKFYTMNYFLSDNSMEVKEIAEQNSGKYAFPMLLKRQKLAKKPILTHCPGMSLRQEDYYQPADLECGSDVHVYGRQCLIYDCNAFTKQWYAKNLGLTQNPVALRKPRPNLVYQAVPPHTGYGTEEDSMGGVVSLNPKAPKCDMKKVFKQDMHILRFNAKLVSTEPDDETREFIISFYCGDDSVLVYEVCDKNSGRIGGKFMERKKHKSPTTKAYYAEKDFLIGRTVYLGGFKFQLNSADSYTEKYMADNPDQFPEAALENIISKIKKPASQFPSLQDYVIDLLARLDKNGDQLISFQEFSDGLKGMQIFLTHQEEASLMKRFDHNGDGFISMEEFYNTLAAVA